MECPRRSQESQVTQAEAVNKDPSQSPVPPDGTAWEGSQLRHRF